MNKLIQIWRRLRFYWRRAYTAAFETGINMCPSSTFGRYGRSSGAHFPHPDPNTASVRGLFGQLLFGRARGSSRDPHGRWRSQSSRARKLLKLWSPNRHLLGGVLSARLKEQPAWA